VVIANSAYENRCTYVEPSLVMHIFSDADRLLPAVRIERAGMEVSAQ